MNTSDKIETTRTTHNELHKLNTSDIIQDSRQTAIISLEKQLIKLEYNKVSKEL